MHQDDIEQLIKDGESNQTNMTHKDTKIFTYLYSLCGVLIFLSVMFPIINSDGSIKLFWNIGTITTGLFVITFLIIVVSVAIIELAKRLTPPIRSRLFFIIPASLLFIINLLMNVAVYDVSNDYSLIFVIGIYAPILYYSLVLLYCLTNNGKLRIPMLILGCISISLIFVPTFARQSVYQYVVMDKVQEYWLITFSTFILSLISVFITFFVESKKSLSKASLFLVTISYLSLSVSTIMSSQPMMMEDLSDHLKFFFALYGVFFLMSFSFAEIWLKPNEEKSVNFAKPHVKITSD